MTNVPNHQPEWFSSHISPLLTKHTKITSKLPPQISLDLFQLPKYDEAPNLGKL